MPDRIDLLIAMLGAFHVLVCGIMIAVFFTLRDVRAALRAIREGGGDAR